MAIVLSLNDGTSASFAQNEISIGCSPHCDFVVPAIDGIADEHALVRRIADRWLIESKGDWRLRVGGNSPDTRLWIRCGDLVDLAARGPTLHVSISESVTATTASRSQTPTESASQITRERQFDDPTLAVLPSTMAELPMRQTQRDLDQPTSCSQDESSPESLVSPQNSNVPLSGRPTRSVSRRLQRRRKSEFRFFITETLKVTLGGLIGIAISYYAVCHLLPDSALLQMIAEKLPESLQPQAIRGESP